MSQTIETTATPVTDTKTLVKEAVDTVLSMDATRYSAAGLPIPEGYLDDAQGRLVPEAQVRLIDKVRDDLVRELVTKAKSVNRSLSAARDHMMSDIAAFCQLAAEQYDAKIGGDKGNVTLLSYDGKYKVMRAISDQIAFDEGLQAGKAIIDECLTRWTKNSPVQLRAVVDRAFQVNKQGRINTNAILALGKLEIDDERWQQAMKAIRESVTVQSSKTYVRVYERDINGKYQPINMDISSL